MRIQASIQGTLLQLDPCADEQTETTTVARQKINDKFKPLLCLAGSEPHSRSSVNLANSCAVSLGV
jgi:hypothetical protein